MAKRLPISEIKALIDRAIMRNTDFVLQCKDDQNPQTRELVTWAKARTQAYQSIAMALRGDASLLRIDAEI